MQKTVLVTGCSSGIGLESALDLTRQGFRVLAACRKAEDVARMQELGLTGILLDLDDPQSVERAAAEVIALTDNRLYGLFNNAGYGVYGPLNTISRQQMEQQFSANFFGAHQLTMLLLPAMTPHGEGRIVMTSSVMGLIASPGRGAYAASKYALEAWSDALRMELRRSGIQVSLIEPGPIRTEADELTYSLHIMVRYELEKALMQGTLAVANLPAAWNAKYKEYLGVDVPDDAHGCLQDIHWSMGDIGYFPSYALGSAYGAQALDDLRKTNDFDAQWANGNVEPLKAALKERVWQWGSMKEPAWLVESLCGGKFDPHHFTDYLKKKYTELYEL